MKLKIAVAGLGRIGKIHFENLLQLNNVHLISVMDPNQEALNYAKEKGIENLHTNFNELVSQKELEAVVICTPTNTHADYIQIASKAGKQIFCEKPLDLKLERVKEIIEVVEQTKTKLMIGFNRRFDDEFKKLKTSIKSGNIGTPHIIKITSRDPSPPSIDYIKNSGGLFLDMTIHDFDMARFLVDKEIDEVYARGEALNDIEISKAGDIDTAVITMKYVDSTIAIIDNSRKAVYGYDQRIEVFGTQGMIQVDNLKVDNNTLFDKSGIKSSLPLNFFLERYQNAYKSEINNFVNSVIKNKPISVSAYDGMKSLQIALAAKKSLKENRPVKISEIN